LATSFSIRLLCQNTTTFHSSAFYVSLSVEERDSYLLARCLSVFAVAQYLCPSCCPSRSCIVSKQIGKHIFNFFLPFFTTQFFHTKRYGNIPTKPPPPIIGACKWGTKNIFDQSISSSRVVKAATIRCYKHSVTGSWQVGDTHR